MAPLDDLLDTLFDGKRPPLYYEVADWMRASRRYRAFVEANRGKIRAKITRLRSPEEGADLRAELQTAAVLLREESFTLAYEMYAALPGRGPDFTVTWKTHTPVNVEVRRLRLAELALAEGEARTAKLVHLLVDKIGQTQPGILNLLWIAGDAPAGNPASSNTASSNTASSNTASSNTASGNTASGNADALWTFLAQEVARVMQTLRDAAERSQDEFFARRGYRNASDFRKRSQQLSAIALHQPTTLHLWQNPMARHKLPAPLLAAFARTVP